ncbi:MAG: NAD-dependent epimerase/dehydratase family protein, partial [Nevskiales bacterium]
MRIAIIGATGLLGQHAARAARARGHELHVIHRAASRLDALADLDYTASTATLDDRD